MFDQTHAGLGWVIGVAAPTSDRRLRTWCTAAALLPDVDALAMLAGPDSYTRFHHTFGHNIFTGILCVAAAAWFFRGASTRTWLAAIALVALCFASHILTDMKLSGWELKLLWPLNQKGFEFNPNLQLGHPVNYVLVYVFMSAPWALAFWKGVTPLEIVSPRLDRLVLNLFRRKNRDCSACGKACNNRCDTCTRPVCLRHGRVGWRFRVACPDCASGRAPKSAGDGVDETLARELGYLRAPETVRFDPEFAAFLDAKLSAGLKRLDAVPRTHALWQGSDGRPTLAKVVDLCRKLLHEAPDDEEARWVLFADSVRACSADFAPIEPLVLRDFASFHWLVAAARWNWRVSGVDPVVALRRPFASLDRTVGSLEDVLQELLHDPERRTQVAAGHGLDLLHGKNPFKA